MKSTGQILHLPLDAAGCSGTSVYDDSYNRIEGVSSVTPSFGADQSGTANGAMVFDGTDGKVSLARMPISSSFTVAFFMYLNPATYSYWSIMGNEVFNSNGFTVATYGNNGRAFLRLSRSGAFDTYWGGSAAVPTEAWQHLAFVVDSDANNVASYADGESLGSPATLLNPYVRTDVQAFVGGTSVGWPPINGRLSNVRLFNRALSGSEINDIYHIDSEQ